jgi:nucleoside-diphosphate-sugar epimerase
MHIDDGRVISNFIVQALRGEPITIYGDGRQTRAFCYVDDLIEGFVRLMNTSDDVTGPVNLGNPTEISIRELANKIIELTGSRSPILTKPLPEGRPPATLPGYFASHAATRLEAHDRARTGIAAVHRIFRSSSSGFRLTGADAMPIGRGVGA